MTFAEWADYELSVLGGDYVEEEPFPSGNTPEDRSVVPDTTMVMLNAILSGEWNEEDPPSLFIHPSGGCVEARLTAGRHEPIPSRRLEKGVCGREMTEWSKHPTIRHALLAEIKRWLEKEPKDSMDYVSMCFVCAQLKNDVSPWQYILKTKETHFIDEYALISNRVLHSLPEDEKECMNKWLTDEGLFDTVY